MGYHKKNNDCQCEHCRSIRSAAADPSESKTISGYVRGDGSISKKIMGDFSVTKPPNTTGVYSVRYVPPFSALIPGLPQPVMIQAFLPVASNYNDNDLLGLSPNIFAVVLGYSAEGFRYITFQIVEDQIIQRDADVQFAAFGYS